MSPQEVEELRKAANDTFKPIPSMVPEVRGNPVTREKTELGRMLWFDPRLSASGILSCNSCHNLAAGGSDNIETSIGHGWQKGPRNSPTVLNSVFNVAQFWDGRAQDLRTQAKGPIQAACGDGCHPRARHQCSEEHPRVSEPLQDRLPWRERARDVRQCRPGHRGFRGDIDHPASRFDQFLEGNVAVLNNQEKHGLKLFMETGCSGCHSGVNLGGQDYFPFGVVERPGSDILPPEDKGRFAVTKTASDEYVFRAVPLRNVELTTPYFHSGKVWNLEQAVAIMGVAQLGKELTPQETSDIAAFLRTLTGQQPRVELPLLPASTAQTPRPEPLVKNSLEKSDAVEKQNSLR
jgi:cytochrome c peroxidase